MRIVYLTQWFEPEPNIVKGMRFVRALAAAGHEVTVVTGFPNYPGGRLYPGYRLRPIARETIDGVAVIRLPLYPSHDASSLRRSLTFLTFFLSVLAYLLIRRRHFDLAYVYHPPITVGLAAALAGRLRPLPFVLDVQDLWPDTIAATGMAGAGWIAPALGAACWFVYARAAAIIVQSAGMRRLLVERGVPAGKVSTIHNWAGVEDAAQVGSERGSGPFTFVYGGNLGRAQALGTVLEAAAILAREGAAIDIVLYGDGIEASALRAHADRAGLASVRFAGRVSQAEIVAAFGAADALLLHLADAPLFAVTVPSKAQFYLAMGRPILAGVGGEAAELLGLSGAATVVPPGDAAALARAMLDLAATPAPVRAAMGKRGRLFYRETLAFDRGVARTLDVLESTHSRTRTARLAQNL
jgi:colanic acid biosynthesis glycosyl transferase WcaI